MRAIQRNGQRAVKGRVGGRSWLDREANPGCEVYSGRSRRCKDESGKIRGAPFGPPCRKPRCKGATPKCAAGSKCCSATGTPHRRPSPSRTIPSSSDPGGPSCPAPPRRGSRPGRQRRRPDLHPAPIDRRHPENHRRWRRQPAGRQFHVTPRGRHYQGDGAGFAVLCSPDSIRTGFVDFALDGEDVTLRC